MADHAAEASATSSGELIARVRAGDAQALDELCQRYLPRLRRWAHGRLPEAARGALDTDDLVLATMSDVARKVPTFEQRFDRAFQALVRQALLNRLRDEARRVARRGGPAAPLEAADAVADLSPSPLERTVGRETVERYEAALAALGEDERAAVVARIELGCSYQEIAELVGKPSADAARMMVSRALVRVAEAMRDG